MRISLAGRLGLIKPVAAQTDALTLGITSIGTQTIFLRQILSSQSGGELYAALALGGWIGAVGLGSILAGKLRRSRLGAAWLLSAVIKIPLAALIFVYPSFFGGLLDPIRYIPLIIIAAGPVGLLYGAIFSFVITPERTTSEAYSAEALGSILGGLSVTIWVFLGLGDFGFLALLAGIELARLVRRPAFCWSLTLFGLAVGLLAAPWLENSMCSVRWPGFSTTAIGHGPSGTWVRLERGDQITTIHNGQQIASVPDRPLAEEALFWPILFRPKPRNMLLIGYEGIPVSEFLPDGIEGVRLIFDRAYLKLGIPDSTPYAVVDPLVYSGTKFDIVAVRLYGASSLSEYRFETSRFFDHCRNLMADGGVVFVSAPSDENYISPDLGRYLASLLATLRGSFVFVGLVPSSRVGFICASGDSLVASNFGSLSELDWQGIESPYFNEALVHNVQNEYRQASFASAANFEVDENKIERPSSVLYFLKWEANRLGFGEGLFSSNGTLIAFWGIIGLVMVLFIHSRIAGFRLAPMAGTYIFGFFGMGCEIGILYLFQVLMGALYLHLGLLIAAFMAGLFWGTTRGSQRSYWGILVAGISAPAMLLALTLAGSAGIGLPIAGGFLYLAAVVSGFATGAGFAYVAVRFGQDRRLGSAIYGSDLFGALGAALVAPMLLIGSGAYFLSTGLMITSIINWMILNRAKE